MAIRFAGKNRNKVYMGTTSASGMYQDASSGQPYSTRQEAPGLSRKEYNWLKEYGWKRGDATPLGETLVAPEGKAFPRKAKGMVMWRPKSGRAFQG